MKVEYDEIHRAGLVLQLDCPDLAFTRHRIGVDSLEDFRRFVGLHVEAIDHATRTTAASPASRDRRRSTRRSCGRS
jgi:5-methyltetrahydropteroyltriglutamate--homocysteine methyltransferase